MKLYPVTLTSPYISQLVHHTIPASRSALHPPPLGRFVTFIKSPAGPRVQAITIGGSMRFMENHGARARDAERHGRSILVILVNFKRLFSQTIRKRPRRSVTFSMPAIAFDWSKK
jgi:hypothetical protein